MKGRNDTPVAPPLAKPSEMADFLRDRPCASSSPDGWEGIVLQRFSDLPSVIDVPPMRDEVLVYHLGGPFLAEVGTGTPHYKRQWIGPGQLGVNPAGAAVRRELKGRPDVVLLHLAPARLRSIAEEMFGCDPTQVELVPAIGDTDKTAEWLIGLLLREATTPGVGLTLLVDGLTRALMVHVLRQHSNLTPVTSEPSDSISPGRVRRVIDHMHSHLDQTLTLANLALIGGLSTSRFVRAFRTATGQPPHRFLLQLRINEACRLLEQTDLSVTEVGLRSGFEQPSHFASMFRSAVGMSPSAWRRARRF